MKRREQTGSIVYEMEIPLKVCYRWVPPEGDGWNEPHIPSHIEVEDVLIPTEKEILTMVDEHAESIEQECEEDMNEL